TRTGRLKLLYCTASIRRRARLYLVFSYLTYGLVSFFLNDTTTTDFYTLSLHDALPILTTILKRRGCLTVPRLTLMSLIKMMLVMVSVAAISKTFGLLRFLLRLSFLAK